MDIHQLTKSSKISILESQVLLERITGKSREQQVVANSYLLSPDELKQWERLSEQVANGVPLAYVVGWKEFYGNDFVVNSKVLIPRPETEQIVDYAVNRIINSYSQKNPYQVLEIGTGSGCIIISLVLEINKRINKGDQIRYFAADISKDALKVARQNAQRLAVSRQINFVQSDLFANIPESKYDLVVANLPYLSSNEAANNKYEPQMALVGGEQGTELNSRLLEEVKGHLNNGGLLIYETYNGVVKKRSADDL